MIRDNRWSMVLLTRPGLIFWREERKYVIHKIDHTHVFHIESMPRPLEWERNLMTTGTMPSRRVNLMYLNSGCHVLHDILTISC